MAFAIVTFENKRTNQIKEVPVGFSWTHLFFGFFVPLFRSDWKFALIFFVVTWFTFGAYVFVTSFFYNKLYAEDLIKAGFKLKNLNGANASLVKKKTWTFVGLALG